MSEEQNNTSESETTTESENKLAGIAALKDANPKVFFGAIGGVVLLLVIILLMGGSDTSIPKHQAKNISVGQTYKLVSANSADVTSGIKLVSAPGSLAAFDDTEADDRSGCKILPPNTRVKALQTADAFGKADSFVQVEMVEGECQGLKGWVLTVNLQ